MKRVNLQHSIYWLLDRYSLHVISILFGKNVDIDQTASSETSCSVKRHLYEVNGQGLDPIDKFSSCKWPFLITFANNSDPDQDWQKSALICIQTVWHSDAILVRIVWKHKFWGKNQQTAQKCGKLPNMQGVLGVCLPALFTFGKTTTSHWRHITLNKILREVVPFVENFCSQLIQCGPNSPYSPYTAV